MSEKKAIASRINSIKARQAKLEALKQLKMEKMKYLQQQEDDLSSEEEELDYVYETKKIKDLKAEKEEKKRIREEKKTFDNLQKLTAVVQNLHEQIQKDKQTKPKEEETITKPPQEDFLKSALKNKLINF